VHPDHHHPVRDRGVPDRRLRGLAFRPNHHHKPTAGVGSFIGNIVWLILLGWEPALAHLATALLLAVTIIGIPLAVANVKLIPVSLWPLGREVVAIEVARKRGIAVTTPQSLGGA
jgi:uncharacterized membrane protein YccF (DUF307 family)